MDRLLDPKNDFMFKQLFGTEKRKDLTIHFINSLMEEHQPKVVDVTFLPLSLDKEITVLRPSIVDVRCQAEDGRVFIVEMQRASDAYFIPRVVEYTCQVYVNQRTKDLTTPRDRGGYDKMHPVVCLAVMENTLFPDKKAFLSHHSVRDVVTNIQDIDQLFFTFLELSKFHKKIDELSTDADKWAYFLKDAPSSSEEDIEILQKHDPIFTEAVDSIVQVALDTNQYLSYLRFDQKRSEIEIQKDEARAEGRAEGLEEGEAKGRAEGEAKGRAEGRAEGEKTKAVEMSRKLLAQGVPAEAIAVASGLSVEEILALKE